MRLLNVIVTQMACTSSRPPLRHCWAVSRTLPVLHSVIISGRVLAATPVAPWFLRATPLALAIFHASDTTRPRAIPSQAPTRTLHLLSRPSHRCAMTTHRATHPPPLHALHPPRIRYLPTRRRPRWSRGVVDQCQSTAHRGSMVEGTATSCCASLDDPWTAPRALAC